MKRLGWLVLVCAVLVWPVPGLVQAQASVAWQEVVPGQGAVCTDGSPFKFYVNRGDPKRLVIFLQGGGACWDAATCSVPGRIFRPRVEIDELREGQGIYALQNPGNPFREWTFVMAPYCSADVHWGHADRTYAAGLTIQHRGGVNALTVLSWIYANVPDPEQIVVLGRSAGAYGSIMWAPYLMRRYPNARVVQLGDVGAGIVTDDFGGRGFANWNAGPALPSWIPSLNAMRNHVQNLTLVQLYTAVAQAYPRNVVAQYNTALDTTQIFFYALMKGEREPSRATALEWAQKMPASLAQIKAQAPSFYFYVAPGNQHGILTFPEFYTVNVGGVRFLDWIKQLIAIGRAPDVTPPPKGPA